MRKRECKTCVKHKTSYCPNSIECMAIDDKPYYQNRIMLLEENKQLKDNQVRAMNKIRDFINNANCEIKEGKYSNDNHELYWKLFREKLTNIQKLIKGINTDEYVNIPKYREEELLNLEDNWNKLKAYFNERIEVCDNRLSSPFCNFEKTTKERLIFSQCLEKLEELEGSLEDEEN